MNLDPSKAYILGYESISALGIGKKNLFESLKKNHLGGKKITRFDTSHLPVQVGAEISEDLSPFLKNYSMGARQSALHDRKLELALAASEILSETLSPFSKAAGPDRSGIVLGIGLDVTPIEQIGASLSNRITQTQDIYLDTLLKLNTRKDDVNTFCNPIDISSQLISKRFGLDAFQETILTACSSSAQALALGLRAIRNDRADLVVAGGSDSLLNLFGYVAFSRLGVIVPVEGADHQTCRPFDKNRSSVLLGEGAGLFILASARLVKSLGLEPKTALIGYGNTMDGYKITAPDPSGAGMKRAIRGALKNSNLKPNDIQYINAHGTGTRANDPVESEALIEIFGNNKNPVSVSSTKDRHGHGIAAAGVIEASVTCLAIENHFVPCTRNLEKPILENGIDLITTENREQNIRYALSNSFAFGGINTVLAFEGVQL